MYSSFFDLDTAEGIRLNSTFTAYTEAELTEPVMRQRLAMDFPMLENDVLMKAEEALLHIHGRSGRTGDSDIEWIRVCDQNERFEPLNSTARTQFLREDNPRLLLKTRFVNLNFGESGCDEIYIVGIRHDPDDKPVILTHMHVQMDKSEIACTQIADLTRNDICWQSESPVQSYELVIWKKNDPEYIPKTLQVHMINSTDVLPKLTQCIINTDADISSISRIDIRQNYVMGGDICLEVSKGLNFREDLEHIECEFTIDFDSLHLDDFHAVINLPFQGGRLFREWEGFSIGYFLPDNSEKHVQNLMFVDAPVCFAEEGSYELNISVWGRKLFTYKINFEESPIPDDMFTELLNEFDKPEATKKPEPAVKPAFNPFEYVKLDRYTMYHVANAKEEDEIELVNTTDDSNLLTAFPQSETRCISIIARYNIIKEGGTDRFKDKVKFRLYDNTGRLLSERTAFYCEFESTLMIYAGAGKFCNYRWRKGRYMAEFVFEDTCIAGASFEIGDRRIDGEYEVRHIMKAISRKNSPGNTDDAYTQLMEMIGLGAIKEKIEHTRSLVDFLNKRKAAGLPAKMPALHTCFIGNPGTGKTTTIKMLSCLTRPTEGDAFVDGYSVTKESEQVKRLIGVSPQETAVAPNLSVEENLELICGIHGFSKEKTQAKITELSERFGLDTVLQRKAGKLSGGWQRRVSIAMALISEPKILFLDEPTLGLDVIARHELWETIRSLKGKITIILTTHYMEEAEALSDRIGIMKSGKLLAVGTVEELNALAGTNDFETAFVSIVKEDTAV